MAEATAGERGAQKNPVPWGTGVGLPQAVRAQPRGTATVRGGGLCSCPPAPMCLSSPVRTAGGTCSCSCLTVPWALGVACRFRICLPTQPDTHTSRHLCASPGPDTRTALQNEPVSDGSRPRGGSSTLSGSFHVSGESLAAGNCPLKAALSVPHFNYNLHLPICPNSLPATLFPPSNTPLSSHTLLGFSPPQGFVCSMHPCVLGPEEPWSTAEAPQISPGQTNGCVCGSVVSLGDVSLSEGPIGIIHVSVFVFSLCAWVVPMSLWVSGSAFPTYMSASCVFEGLWTIRVSSSRITSLHVQTCLYLRASALGVCLCPGVHAHVPLSASLCERSVCVYDRVSS